MPFAGYKDFDACVAAQIKSGHSKESAEKICGAIKHKVEDKGKGNENVSKWIADTIGVKK